MKCKTCKEDLTEKNKKKYGGYTRTICTKCHNAASKKIQREKSKKLNEWRKYYN